jgi:hypothetical protein
MDYIDPAAWGRLPAYVKSIEDERDRLRVRNQELLQALMLAESIIGHPDDGSSKFIRRVINGGLP